MRIGYYEGLPGDDPSDTTMHRWLKKLGKKRPDLYSLLRNTLIDVEAAKDLTVYRKQLWVKPLGDNIWEFRIPKKKKGA